MDTSVETDALVRLVAISRPVVDACSSPGELIAYCARVSNPGNQANTETAPRLLRYLVRNAHWSPLEMASMTVEISTTRDIARQILRHRSFSFQEFSQRYAVAEMEPVLRQARLRHETNRQASVDLPPESPHHAEWALDQRMVWEAAQKAYSWALQRGVAKEVARALLPEGMTRSRLYMAGTLRSWVHYVQLRTEAGTQKEHREIAEACKAVLLEQVPELAEVLS